MTILRMTGHDAIRYAAAHSLTLCTFTDPTAVAHEGVSVYEARNIAREDPSLVYLDVPSSALRALRDEGFAVGDAEVASAADRLLCGEHDTNDVRMVTRALAYAAAQADT